MTLVSKNHFQPGAYTNTTEMDPLFREMSRNATTGKNYHDIGYQTDSHDMQQFISMLEGGNGSTPNYEDLTPSQCIRLYSTDFVSDHRNLFLITTYTPDAAYNNTFLGAWMVEGGFFATNGWTCLDMDESDDYLRCNPNKLPSMVASGSPWLVETLWQEPQEVLVISGCKSERVVEKCKVQFSLGIMIAVTCCNFVKACCMLMAVIRSREPTLVTLGDAIDSFLRIPDPTTMGICFADRLFIEKKWRHGFRVGASRWKRKGIQRWWTSVSKTRWITCNFFCFIAIIITGVLLGLGIGQDRKVLSTDIKSL